ncbi:1,5-anhydro-D-fructose reductase-like isoform X1 [Arctopsyche grandis]|uniref:1,5-anhydro-D-fructose reductase-like isoform X1 n=1 Tax=Arctopsyche grandis TaxID=121162 RepID=UPI00406D6ECD
MSKINVNLPTGAAMPALGFGTWQATDEELESALNNALECGYRHIDTALVYENEAVIGKVLKQWLDSGRLKREDLFVVTKLPPSGNHPCLVRKFFTQSLDALQLEYLDLYLIHTPFAFKYVEGNLHPTNEDGEFLVDINTDHIAIWREMEKLQDEGLAKAIGLSNFNERQIKRICDNARVKPSNLQVELHVYFQQRPLVEFCKQRNITITAYSPLGSRGITSFMKKLGFDRDFPDLLSNPVILEIAKKYGKSAGQILLRHIVQRGIAAIPKSTNQERMKQNIDIFDFELSPEDITKVDNLDLGEDGRVCDFAFFKGLNKHPEFPF